MGKFSNPKEVRRKLKKIVKKSRANNKRNKQSHNNKLNGNANANAINKQKNSNNRNNANNFNNKKYFKYNKRDGRNKKESKQFRGIWRCRKGGKRYYIGLNGKEYEDKLARQQCINDKQILEKLAETKRQLQSPSFQYALQQQKHNNNNNNNNNKSSLHYWQIPHEIVQNYAFNGIRSLYKWQIECLSLIEDGSYNNLIYSAPTSGGKTLVSEVLMIRQILLNHRKCILILPFVSLVNEKVNDLKLKLNCLGIIIEAYHSNIGINSCEDVDIICCTIEKGNSIINKLIEEDTISELLGCIVIDEFHYIGDYHRGWILEILLSKVMFIMNDNIQIIGMSATLPNLDDIATWMNAKLYITRNRPVELTQYYKVNNIIYDINGKQIRTIKQQYKVDKDHVVTLCKEVTVKTTSSVLVFCEKKVWCKTCCKMISECLSNDKYNNNKKYNILQNKRKMLILELKELPTPICSVLKYSILYGVAYHHAGLTLEEREIIENGFRKNIINILVATSTLAAGVNLPALRVIFRTPKVGRSYITPSKYKQMSGRAGRKGIDTYGESIVICSNKYESEFVKDKLMNAKLLPIRSQLLYKKQNKKSGNNNVLCHNLQRFILEGFGTNLIKTQNDLKKYLKCSLTCNEIDEKEWNNECQIAIKWLIKHEFLQKIVSTDNDIDIINKLRNDITMDIDIDNDNAFFDGFLEITPLGFATIGSSLDPIQSLLVFEEIDATRSNGIYLRNSLHLCYLLSPIRNNGGNIEPKWNNYYDIYCSLSDIKKNIAQSVGIREQLLCDWSNNISHRPQYRSTNKLHIKYKRFYSALILNKIIEEVPLYLIENKFGIESGQIQSLQSTSSSFANSLSIFCTQLNWNCIAQIIAHASNRLNYGVESELLPLMKISSIKSFKARILYDNGLKTLNDINNATLETIILALRSKMQFTTNNIQQQLLINQAQKIKYEANTVLTRMIKLSEQEET